MSHNNPTNDDSTEIEELAAELGLIGTTPADPVYFRDTGEHGDIIAVYNPSACGAATARDASPGGTATWAVELEDLRDDVQTGNLERVEKPREGGR